MKIVLIDNGHGYNTPGKCSPDKSVLEYAYVRKITKGIYDRLTAEGYKCILIVPETYDVSLTERARRVNQYCKQYGTSNCFLISVHLNAAGGDVKVFLRLVDNSSDLIQDKIDMFHAILDYYVMDTKHLYAKYNLERADEEVVVAEDSEDDDELFGTTVKSGSTFTGAAAEQEIRDTLDKFF